MSTAAINWAWRQIHLKPNQKYVLIALAEFAGMSGEDVWPGVKRVAAMTGYSERQVTRTLAELVDAGALRVIQPGGWGLNGKPQATHYEMTLYAPKRPGDRLAPGTPRQSVADPVTNCPNPGDGLTPQPRTRTKNQNQEHSAAAPRSSAAVDPIKGQAIEITNRWWESHDPRPTSGTYPGYRSIVERLIRSGWSPDSVARAAADCGRTMTIPAMERALDKRKGRTESYAETDTSGEHRTTVNPDSW